MSRDRIIIRREENDADEDWNKHVRNEVYNTSTLAWEAQTVTSSGPPLSVGAATSAKQDTGNNYLATLANQTLPLTSRTYINFYAIAAAAGATTTETAITLTKSSGTSATTTGTSFSITNGNKYRIQTLILGVRGHATGTAQSTTFNLRINTSGAVTTSTTPVVLSFRVATIATNSVYDSLVIPFPDGFDITGTSTLEFGITAAATFTTNAPTWDVNIIGFEY